ncbi:hypothetical protein Pan44_06340 [Caulifigura coniformis]|uniref:Carboxypeptidase regulatory-like domain-containing protein n=1 Tax=Caulifigura coniformis TaxID=2527983 RepID=A0A517S932_9PLAN|nr:hypothetical protein [Caulifigura coniformis]QDT52622.1 hypothetical protein Pan44_06340 [Caulifigura coniformis]
MNRPNVSPLTCGRGKRMETPALRSVCSVVLALVLTGCGDNGPVLVEARGTVLYRGDIVPKANVVFISDDGASMSIGVTDEQGQFQLSTRGRAGALIGPYKVGITAIRLKGPVFPSMTEEQILANEQVVIPRKFGNARKSALVASVSEDPSRNDFRFDLK